MTDPYFRLMTSACCLMASAFCCRAFASELLIDRDAVQTLVVASLFKDQGKWYLSRGTCYSYLERPLVALAGGRLVINAHLTARLGLKLADSCMGTDLASDMQLSGRFVGAGSQIALTDIRIDQVKDDSTRQVIQVLQSAGVSPPKTVDIDLLPLLKPALVPGTAIRVSVTKLDIAGVTTQADRVSVDFDMKLNAR